MLQAGRGAYHDELNRHQSDARTAPASMAQLRVKVASPTDESQAMLASSLPARTVQACLQTYQLRIVLGADHAHV